MSLLFLILNLIAIAVIIRRINAERFDLMAAATENGHRSADFQRKVCFQCGYRMKTRWKFCPVCGKTTDD